MKNNPGYVTKTEDIVENTKENRYELASEMVALWDLESLVCFAVEYIVEEWEQSPEKFESAYQEFKFGEDS